MNTCVDHIARRQARLGHFAISPSPSPSPSPEASANEEGEDVMVVMMIRMLALQVMTR